MKRRSFFAAVAGLVASPVLAKLPVPEVMPVVACTLTPTQVTREAAMLILHRKLRFVQAINRMMDENLYG